MSGATRSPLHAQDYDVRADIDASASTEVIFAYRQGTGLGQHPNGNRGASVVNFATGVAVEVRP